MRVTQNILTKGIARHLQSSLAKVSSDQLTVASGKKFQIISDDAVAASRSVSLSSSLADIQQYRRNADEAMAWLNATADGLASARQVVQEAKLQATLGAQETTGVQGRAAAADVVANLRTQMLDIANSRFQGRSLFAGNKTSTKAFDGTYGYRGDQNSIIRNIEPGENLEVNVNGEEVFVGAENIFTSLQELEDDLRDNNVTAVNAKIDELGNILDRFLQFEGTIGARTQRLEMTQERLESMDVVLQDLKSQNEDVDIVEAVISLQNSQRLYEASLLASQQLAQMSLVNFSR